MVLFIPSSHQRHEGQRERDYGKNPPVGVSQLEAGFEVVGRREGLAVGMGGK